MICPKCGNQIAPNMKFCSKCGTPVVPVVPPVKETPKEFLQYANPNVKPPQINPQNVAVQQPVQKNNPKNAQEKKKKKNLPLIIVAVVLVIAVIASSIAVVPNLVKNNTEINNATEYIEDFPTLKQQTEFLVYDAEKFPSEKYEIKVERMLMGGIFNGAFKGETVIEDVSTERVYNIDFKEDGDYRITLTDITAERTQATSEDNAEVVEIVIIIDVKVDNDAPEALDRVDINSKPGDEVGGSDATADSELVKAVDSDFDNLTELINEMYKFGCFEGYDTFDSNDAGMDFVDNTIHVTYWGLYEYIFGKEAECSDYTDLDPLGKFGAGYTFMPKEEIKWLCENVFNIEFDENHNGELAYVYGDYYYICSFNAGGGPGYVYELNSQKEAGNKYEVILDVLEEPWDSPSTQYTKIGAVKVTAAIKTEDGKRYWSIYKIEDYDPTSEPTTSVQTTEPTTTTTTATAAKLSADEIVNVYLNNKSVWCKDYDNFISDGYSSSYVFIDLDFDGIPELMTTGIAGSGIFSSNKFYKLNSAKNGVVEITYTADSDEMYDFTEEFPKLLKDKQSGNYVYWCYDVCRAGAFGSGTSYGTLEYSGSKVTQNYKFNKGVVREGGTDKNYFRVVTASGMNEVTESEYNKAYNDFMSDYEIINVKLNYINANEFSNASQSQQREYFKSSLKGYGFNGYVSQVQ